MICLAGALQLRPIPTAELNHLVSEAADPASVQRCTTASHVRYCLYPGFGRDLPSVEAPVNGVLAHLPARPDQPLTVRQVLSPYLLDPTLTHGHPERAGVPVASADAESTGQCAATASAIYLPVGSWPAAGARLADAHFGVALAAAEWAVRLPPQATGTPNGPVFLPCVPVDQAREAIAIWLAILATRPPAGELQDGLGGPDRSVASKGRKSATPSSRPGAIPAGRRLRHASRGAADHGRRVPAGQRDDEPAGTEGRPRPEGRMGHMAELAHHRRPARRRARHTACPPCPHPPGPPRTPGPGITVAQPGSGPQNPVCTA